jgi:DNA-binding transcriptional ArsR family regulator
VTALRSPFSAGFTDRSATALADVLKAIASPHRLKILALLNSHGRLRVSDLTVHLADLKQPTVWHHVRWLSAAGLVVRSVEGANVWCSLDSHAVADVATALSPWQDNRDVPAGHVLFNQNNTREDLGRLVAEIFGPRPDAAA